MVSKTEYHLPDLLHEPYKELKQFLQGMEFLQEVRVRLHEPYKELKLRIVLQIEPCAYIIT